MEVVGPFSLVLLLTSYRPRSSPQPIRLLHGLSGAAISDVSSTWLYWPEVGNDASRVWLFFHLAKRFANCLTSRSSSRGSFGFVMEDCAAAFGKGREGGV